jgi:hypothetical protein
LAARNETALLQEVDHLSTWKLKKDNGVSPLVVHYQLVPIYLTYLMLVITIRACAISLYPQVQVIVVNDIAQVRGRYAVRLCACLIQKQLVPPMLIVYQQRHTTIMNPRRFFQALQEYIS